MHPTPRGPGTGCNRAFSLPYRRGCLCFSSSKLLLLVLKTKMDMAVLTSRTHNVAAREAYQTLQMETFHSQSQGGCQGSGHFMADGGRNGCDLSGAHLAVWIECKNGLTLYPEFPILVIYSTATLACRQNDIGYIQCADVTGDTLVPTA